MKETWLALCKRDMRTRACVRERLTETERDAKESSSGVKLRDKETVIGRKHTPPLCYSEGEGMRGTF